MLAEAEGEVVLAGPADAEASRTLDDPPVHHRRGDDRRDVRLAAHGAPPDRRLAAAHALHRGGGRNEAVGLAQHLAHRVAVGVARRGRREDEAVRLLEQGVQGERRPARDGGCPGHQQPDPLIDDRRGVEPAVRPADGR